MKTIDLYQVDAFTGKIFGGNPAGVVTNANELSDEEMGQIAREMNLSETAFVLKPTSNKADLKLRYFTPAAEVDFCGHATIGTLYELSRLNMYGLGSGGVGNVKVETNVGILEMSVVYDGDDEPVVKFAAPAVDMVDFRLQGKQFAEKFGIQAGVLRSNTKILIDRALNYVYIPIVSLEELGKLEFDFTRIRLQFTNDNIVVFCLFTDGTFDENSSLHARGLAPLVGVDEDPFTGSMQSGLVHAAKLQGLTNKEQGKIIIEQGNFVGRPGFATVSHDVSSDTISVAAQAAHVFSTKIEL